MDQEKRRRISCIVPTLGRGAVLCDTVRLLLKQSYSAHEIILVDQTATPDAATREVLAAWDRSGAIRWLHQTEPNASKARNAGALAATGDVVLFLDDDIRISADFLANYAEVLARTGAIGVSGQILEGDLRPVTDQSPKAFNTELGWLLYFKKNYGRECETSFMMSGNVAIRRDVFLALGGMDENYERGAHREETDFAMRFRKAGYRFVFSPQCTLYHLGPKDVPQGGARSWQGGKDFCYFHHCVGDWYFNLKFARGQLVLPLFRYSVRHFVLNRQTYESPLRLVPAALYWLAAAPVAYLRRTRGPKLISVHTLTATHSTRTSCEGSVSA